LPEYTEDARYERFLKIANVKDNEKPKILIISDFINKAG
jgi:hypothetical protein